LDISDNGAADKEEGEGKAYIVSKCMHFIDKNGKYRVTEE